MISITKKLTRGEERLRGEGEKAKSDREEGERNQKNREMGGAG